MNVGETVYAVRSVANPNTIIALLPELKDIIEFVRISLRDPNRFVKYTAANTPGVMYYLVYVPSGSTQGSVYNDAALFIATEEILGRPVLAHSGNGIGFICA